MIPIERLFREFRYSCRSLARTPGFTAAAVLTLALGIGAASAIFSVVDAVLLEPLPYPDAARRVMIWSRWKDFDKTWVSDAEVGDYRACKTLAGVAAWQTGQANLTGDGEPLRIGVGLVTANTFSVLGVQAIVGRAFLPGEDQKGRDQVAVISYGLWQRRYGGSREALQKPIYLDGAPRTIVGVMPRGFHLPTDFGEDAADPTQAWLPLALDPAERGSHGLYAAAVMRTGVGVRAVNAELEAITTNNTRAGLYPTAMGFSAFALPLDEEILGSARPALWLVGAAVALLLLVACANVANLMLARAEGRHRELAVRAALGGGRLQLAAHVLTEGLVLAAAGTVAGLVLAWGATRLLGAAQFDAFPRLANVTLDGGVLGFSVVLTIATTALFGVAPVLRVMRLNLSDSMRQGARGGAESGRRRGRGAIVVAEMALAVVLVIAAGLMVRSLAALYRLPLGIDARNVLTARLSLPASSYDTPEKTVQFYERLLRQVRTLPMVRQAGAIRSLPLAATIGDWGLDVDGYAESPGHNAKGDWQVSTDGAAEALGERLVSGRAFTPTDTSESMLVVVVNETMARKYWSGRSPIGGRIRMGSDPNRPWLTVVGVVGDVRHNGLTGAVKEKFYVPHAQFHRSVGRAIPSMTLVVKTTGDPLTAIAPIRSIVQRMDPNVPVATVRPMTDVVAGAMSAERFTGGLLLAFASIALALAAIGVYGVLAYLVSRRTHEIGVRLAIGAPRRAVVGLVLRRGLALSLSGAVIGVLAAYALTRLMATMLYGVGATDLVTFVTVPVLLAVVALGACALPAWRAACVQPLTALRTD